MSSALACPDIAGVYKTCISTAEISQVVLPSNLEIKKIGDKTFSVAATYQQEGELKQTLLEVDKIVADGVIHKDEYSQEIYEGVRLHGASVDTGYCYQTTNEMVFSQVRMLEFQVASTLNMHISKEENRLIFEITGMGLNGDRIEETVTCE